MTTTEPIVKRNSSPRDVNYTIEEVDELPPQGTGGGGASMLETLLEKVKAGVETGTHSPEKFYKIGDYRVNSACTAAATTLRYRHGAEYVEGWSFASRKLPDGRSGLFVRFNPEVVVHGGRERFEREVAEAKAKREKNKEAKAKAAAAESAKSEKGGKQEARSESRSAAS